MARGNSIKKKKKVKKWATEFLEPELLGGGTQGTGHKKGRKRTKFTFLRGTGGKGGPKSKTKTGKRQHKKPCRRVRESCYNKGMGGIAKGFEKQET